MLLDGIGAKRDLAKLDMGDMDDFLSMTVFHELSAPATFSSPF